MEATAVRSSAAEVLDGCKLPDVSAGNRLGSTRRAMNTLKDYVTSPAPTLKTSYHRAGAQWLEHLFLF